MNDKDLARLWNEIRAGELKPAEENNEEAALFAIAREVTRENQECPEPPSDLQGRIMADISKERLSALKIWHNWRATLVPLAASISVIMIAIMILGQDQLREVLSPSSPHPTISTNDLPSHSGGGRVIRYNDERVVEATSSILLYAESSLGACILVFFAAGAILCAFLKRYRTSLILLLASILTFLLRSLISFLFMN